MGTLPREYEDYHKKHDNQVLRIDLNEIKQQNNTQKMIINYIFTPFFLQMKSNKND